MHTPESRKIALSPFGGEGPTINIKNNRGTINNQELNTLRVLWGSKLTIIHD